jgi:hypothetical protein
LAAAVELIRVFERRLREHDSELVTADTTRDVGRAHDAVDSLRCFCEHRVAGQVSDPVVDLLEVVEVEHDQRELALVAVRARDLASECLVEEAAVVEAGEGVQVCQPARFAEAARVLDRRSSPCSQGFELAHVVLARRTRDPGVW